MKNETDFQQQLQRVGELVHELDTIADPSSRTAAKHLMQLLMDLHGSGLERILEVVFQSGECGPQIIDQLGQDPLVSSLLILYGLHPEHLQTRVERKLEQIRSKLFKQGSEARLVSVNGNDVRVHISLTGHMCGSTREVVRSTVEEALYEAAPDLTSVAIEGLETAGSSGFVGLDKVMSADPSGVFETTRSDGMD